MQEQPPKLLDQIRAKMAEMLPVAKAQLMAEV